MFINDPKKKKPVGQVIGGVSSHGPGSGAPPMMPKPLPKMVTPPGRPNLPPQPRMVTPPGPPLMPGRGVGPAGKGPGTPGNPGGVVGGISPGGPRNLPPRPGVPPMRPPVVKPVPRGINPPGPPLMPPGINPPGPPNLPPPPPPSLPPVLPDPGPNPLGPMDPAQGYPPFNGGGFTGGGRPIMDSNYNTGIDGAGSDDLIQQLLLRFRGR